MVVVLGGERFDNAALRDPAAGAFVQHAAQLVTQSGEPSDTRLHLDSDSAILTRRKDGALVLALWTYAAPYGTGANYTPPPATLPPARTFSLHVKGVSVKARVQLWRLDADHGNVVKAYDAMGRTALPTRAQISQLQAAGLASPSCAS